MNPNTQKPSLASLDLKEIISSYTQHWKWFVLSVLVTLVLAFLYTRYATPQYAAQAKIQILEDKNSGSGMDAISDLSIFTGGKNKVEDELEIINSRSNFVQVVKELGLNIRVIALGNIKDTELYNDPPIKLNFIAADSIINKADFSFYVTLSSSTTFGYSEKEDDPIKAFAYGKNITTPVGDIVITPNMEGFEKYRNKRVKVVINPLGLVAQAYSSQIIVAPSDEKSNVVDITLQDPNKDKARDIINALIRIYNQNAIQDKRIIADRTSSFINERISVISSNLSSVDQSAEDFKTEKGVTDVASEANINLNVGVANQQNLANVRTQYNIASSMKDLVSQQKDYEVMPTNVGLSDPTLLVQRKGTTNWCWKENGC